MTGLFEIPIVGGLTVGLFISVNVVAIRYALQYLRETREEYVKKLTQAVIEAEYQKTENMRLRYQLDRLAPRQPQKDSKKSI